MKPNTVSEGDREKEDTSHARAWERLTLKHPSAGQTGSVCNSLSTKTHSVYLGQQEEGPREEKSKSQRLPSLASSALYFLCNISSFPFAKLDSNPLHCTGLLFSPILPSTSLCFIYFLPYSLYSSLYSP